MLAGNVLFEVVVTYRACAANVEGLDQLIMMALIEDLTRCSSRSFGVSGLGP